MPSPFNPAAHEFLLANGYTHSAHPADFDDGTPESGPGYGGHPAYDQYTSAEDMVFISEGSRDTHFELRDLEAEAFEASMYTDEGAGELVEDDDEPVQPEAEFKAGWAAAQAALEAAGWREYGYTQGEHTWIHDSYPSAMISCLPTNSLDEGGWVHQCFPDGRTIETATDEDYSNMRDLGQGMTGQELVEHLSKGEHA